MGRESCKKSMYSFLVNQDIYGFPVTFNFNKNGDTYKTSFGGGLSIIIKCFLGFYVGFLLKKFIFREEPNQSIGSVLLKLDDMEPTKFKDLKVVPYLALKKQLEGFGPLYLNRTGLEEYLDIYAVQKS